MLAVVGQSAPFDQGREQMKLLAGLEVTTKAVERTAQTKWDDEGYAIRDPDSTTYHGAIETAAEFGRRTFLHAWERGWDQAGKKVVMGDGAAGIWTVSLPWRRSPPKTMDTASSTQARRRQDREPRTLSSLH